MRTLLLTLATVLLVALAPHAVRSQDMQAKAETGFSVENGPELSVCSPDGVAVGGYDVISYRQPDGPVRGDADITAEHNGDVYRFTSE
ncbi:MAG: hypothetical protein AAGA61_01585, partial [Pseudomonadota bacterium]